MNPNILYISYDGMTDPLGQSQVLPYISGLSKLGYLFTLISCEKPERYEATKAEIEKICLEHNINWMPVMYTKKPPILSTIKDILKIQKMVYKLQENTNFQLVHCRSYISALIGLGLKKRYGVKFVFDMRGFWADERVDAGVWNRNKWIYNIIYKFFKRKEREFFLNADYSVCLTHSGKKEIYSWDYMKNKKDNIVVIPCCVDTSLFDYNLIENRKIDTWKQKFEINEGDLILTYLGSIGTWYMLEEMLDFFVVLKKQKSEVKFLFITHDEQDKIRAQAAKRGVLKDIIIQSAKRTEVPELLKISSYSVFFIRPTYSKISSSPTKQGELMAMGIPVICNSGVGDTDTIVNKYHSGKVVSTFTKSNYEEIISQMLTEEFNSAELRKDAIDYFSLEKGVDAYLKIYKAIIDS